MKQERDQHLDPEKAQGNKEPDWTDGEDLDPPGGPLHDLVIGYPKLAGRMAAIPQTACFRSFGALNTRNLLCLQCELMFLEEKLKEAEKEDSLCDVGKNYAVNHLCLLRSDRDGNTTQLELVKEFRTKSKEYNEALIHQHAITQMKEPDPYDIDDIQCFLSNPSMGPRALTGPDCFIWGCYHNKQGFSPDLVCVCPREDADIFTYWLGTHATKMLKACGLLGLLSLSPKSGVRAVRVDTVTWWVTCVIASLVPIVSIVVLERMDSTYTRLGAISAMSFLMSVCLTVFTNATRPGVFIITFAFTVAQIFLTGICIGKS